MNLYVNEDEMSQKNSRLLRYHTMTVPFSFHKFVDSQFTLATEPINVENKNNMLLIIC